MTAQLLDTQTYLPEPSEAGDVAELLSFVKAHEEAHGAKPTPRYFLAGADEHDQVEIPEAVHRLLKQVLAALEAGKAVTVAPRSKLLTTQQAADLLGVSRPTVVKLIDDGKLAAETPAKRRRLVKLDDLLAYRNHRREEQYRALLSTSGDYDEIEDPEVLEERFRRVRAEVAGERRSRTETRQP